MITLLLLLSISKPLLGAPVSLSCKDALSNGHPSLALREDPSNQATRSRYDIVQTCLVTIFACIWKSAHPNINGPRDSGWTRFKRRFTIMLVTLIAPELILVWALNQRFSASYIMGKYNENFSAQPDHASTKQKNGHTWTIIAQWLTEWFRTLPKSTTRHGPGHPWTITHGFFIQMGGFVLYEGEYPKEVLTYESLAEYLAAEKIDHPTVTERDLQDRSKGDAVSKGLVLLQMGWFILQCIARAVRHLPLSELEVLTLAFAAMNGFIYAAWWNKPQGVDTVICLQLKSPVCANLSHQDAPLVDKSLYSNSPSPSVDKYIDDKKSLNWLRSKLSKLHGRHCLAQAFLGVFYLVASFVRPLTKWGDRINAPVQDQFRVSMFNEGSSTDSNGGPVFYIFLVTGVIFGGIHLLGWGTPSLWTWDLIMWRVSSLIVAVSPILIAFRSIFAGVKFLGFATYCLALITGLMYCMARCLIFFVALRTIRDAPPGVLTDVTWTTFIPHF